MKRKSNAPLHQVKQLITVDRINAANALLCGHDWILVETYKQRGTLFYVLGRIEACENRR